MEVCSRCKSHNPLHTSAVKTMTCIIGLYNFWGKRGQANYRCFNNPESSWFRPQAPWHQQAKPAVNENITSQDKARPQLSIRQRDRDLGKVKALLISGADIRIKIENLA